MPHERSEHGLVDFWLARGPSPDAVLLTADQVAVHNEHVLGLHDDRWPSGRWDLLHRPVARPALNQRLVNTLERLARSVGDAKVLITAPAGQQPLATARRRLANAEPVDEIRLLRRGAPLRCYPLKSAILETIQLTNFDLGQCSQLRFGEAVRVLARAPGLWYVWSSYASGWVDPEALSGPLDQATARTYLRPERFVVVVEDALAVWSDPHGGQPLGVARLGLRLPVASPRGASAPGLSAIEVSVPGPAGLQRGWIRDAGAVATAHAPLTRRTLFERAFSLLNTPYGWGGMGNKRDCSRLLMDLFGSFGVLLPRNSAWQAKAGVRRLDLASRTPQEKATAIEVAAQGGVVLLYLPGHIMLYVGRHAGRHYALHQFSGYIKPCPGGGETMIRANRTAVTSLDLGHGGSRKSFIERITRLVVFGQPEDVEKVRQAP